MLSARVKTLGAILLVACVGLIVAGGVSFWIQRARLVDDVDDRLIEKGQALRPVGDAPSPGSPLGEVSGIGDLPFGPPVGDERRDLQLSLAHGVDNMRGGRNFRGRGSNLFDQRCHAQPTRS